MQITEIAEMLVAGESRLAEVADRIMESVGAARVSIAEIDETEGAFEIVEQSGGHT